MSSSTPAEGEPVVSMGLGHCLVCSYAPVFVDGELSNPPAGWVIEPGPILPIATGHVAECPDLPAAVFLGKTVSLTEWVGGD